MTNPPRPQNYGYALRGHRVLLDAELAALYGAPTKALNQAVKRNAERFPEISCSASPGPRPGPCTGHSL